MGERSCEQVGIAFDSGYSSSAEQRAMVGFPPVGQEAVVERLSLRVSLQTDADLADGKLEIEVHLVECAGKGSQWCWLCRRRATGWVMLARALGDEFGRGGRGSESIG